MFAQARNCKLQPPNQFLVKHAITISSINGFGNNMDRLYVRGANINFLVRISCGHYWPLRPDGKGSKDSPHHQGRRKTHFLVRTSTILGADVHDPKVRKSKRTPHKRFSKICELFFPLQSPGSPRGGNPRKKGKNLQNSPPRSNPRKWGKITEKLHKKMYFRSIFCNFSVIFPHFRGLDRGGEFCNFFGDFRPGGFRGSVRGKTTRFSKIISRNAKTLESALLAEPHVAVMSPCRTLTRSAKVSCRTLQIAEPKASRKRCDLKTRKRCDFYPAAQKIASDFSAISSAIFWRFFCDFCSNTCDLVLCDLKTQRFFCDCDFLGR